jgi:hypothetical protein
MKTGKLLITIALLLITSLNINAQDSHVDAVDSEKIFTPKDRDFIQLWYYDQVLKMDLNQKGRDDYSSLLSYYTYKMGRLRLAKYNYTDKEMKAEFDKLVRNLNLEMKDFLSDKDYKIHVKSFKKIEDVVYEKKYWDR